MITDIQAFDFSVNLLRAILWQYENAPNLQALLEGEQEWYNINQTEFWEDWRRDVFDLRTANRFGLNVWSIILNQSIYGTIPPDGGSPAWGFSSTNFNFDNGNFISSEGSIYPLPDDVARILLQLRYFQITSSGTVPEINRMLKFVFGKLGNCWLVDNHDMTQGYYFDFPVASAIKYIFNNFDILPRPAGVESTIAYGTTLPFGFSITSTNFDNGNFRS